MRDDIMNLMRSATALVVPSLWYEGFPMVMVEALSFGLPILCSRVGDYPRSSRRIHPACSSNLGTPHLFAPHSSNSLHNPISFPPCAKPPADDSNSTTPSTKISRCSSTSTTKPSQRKQQKAAPNNFRRGLVQASLVLWPRHCVLLLSSGHSIPLTDTPQTTASCR